MTRPEAIEIARKLKALSEKAVDHEKANATQKLKAFCSKHGLDEDEYSTEQVRVSISYKNQEERNLLSNVMCMIMESDHVKGTDKNGAFSFFCSPYEFELIKGAYSYYKKVYREYCEAVLIAMVTKNEITNMNKSAKPFEMEPMTEDEKKEWDEKLKSMQPTEPEPEASQDDSAAKDGQVPPKEQTPKTESDQNKQQDRIGKLLFVMEQNKWQRPPPRAKLFLD